MRVLDANFLIDYSNGDPAAAKYYEANDGDREAWIAPAPAHAETLLGVGNLPDASVDDAIDALAWTEVYAVDKAVFEETGYLADGVGSEGPFLDGVDATVAAVGRELGAPVASADGDPTREETRKVIEVENYRSVDPRQ